MCVCVYVCGVFLCVHAHTKVRQCVSMYSIQTLVTNPTVTLVHLFFPLLSLQTAQRLTLFPRLLLLSHVWLPTGESKYGAMEIRSEKKG